MGKIIVRDGIKWDFDQFLNKYTFIEKVEEKPKTKPKQKKEED